MLVIDNKGINRKGNYSTNTSCGNEAVNNVAVCGDSDSCEDERGCP